MLHLHFLFTFLHLYVCRLRPLCEGRKKNLNSRALSLLGKCLRFSPCRTRREACVNPLKLPPVPVHFKGPILSFPRAQCYCSTKMTGAVSMGPGKQPPWGKGTNILLPCINLWWPIWVNSDLCLGLSRCRTEKAILG